MVKDYRSKARIYADILSSVASQVYAKPTKIMLDANLSYDRLSRYLDTLVEGGLLKRIEGGERLYVITENGRKYLAEFKRFEEFAAAFGLRI
jgi:predicted transcriptional regulator